MVWKLDTEAEQRRQAIHASRERLPGLIMACIPWDLRYRIMEYQFPQKTNPSTTMKMGWCSIPACRWRPKKWHADEAAELKHDEEEDRESM